MSITPAARRTARDGADVPSHCFTIDVEEYFQVSSFDSAARRADWAGHESRVELGTGRILERLDKLGMRATFFVLGWVAERHGDLVRSIARAGHEIACHGYAHEMLTRSDPARFREDIRRAKGILEALVGSAVLGYRAPSLTITRSTLWALPILVQEGFAYDSSIIPVVHDRYGLPGACPTPHRLETDAGPLWEIPPSTASFGGMRLAVCGGGYLRIYPFAMFRWLLRRVQTSGAPIVLFVHPWELDPQQPRLEGSVLSKLRHYRHLDKTAARMDCLLTEFAFGAIREVVPEACVRDDAGMAVENRRRIAQHG